MEPTITLPIHELIFDLLLSYEWAYRTALVNSVPSASSSSWGGTPALARRIMYSPRRVLSSLAISSRVRAISAGVATKWVAAVAANSGRQGVAGVVVAGIRQVSGGCICAKWRACPGPLPSGVCPVAYRPRTTALDLYLCKLLQFNSHN